MIDYLVKAISILSHLLQSHFPASAEVGPGDGGSRALKLPSINRALANPFLHLAVSPNPSRGAFSVHCFGLHSVSTSEIQISLFSLGGNCVRTFSVVRPAGVPYLSVSLNCEDMASGQYLLVARIGLHYKSHKLVIVK